VVSNRLTIDEQEAQALAFCSWNGASWVPVKVALIVFSISFMRSMNQSLDQGFER